MAIPRQALDELAKRRAAARSERAARARIAGLVAAGSFQEFAGFARGADGTPGRRDRTGEGVVTGVGYVDGRPVALFSQDVAVARASIGRAHAGKICDLLEHAGRTGMPVVGIFETGGARLEEASQSLSGFGRLYRGHAQLSGVVPQVAVVAGKCPGAAALLPALADFVVMTRETAFAYVCGPDVIREACGEVAALDQVGGAGMHAAATGFAHFVADGDAAALATVRRLLSFLPSNSLEDPPHRFTDEVEFGADEAMDALAPDGPAADLDAAAVVRRLVDGGDFLEVQAGHAANLLAGFGRIAGCVVGLIANRCTVRGGTLDVDAAEKGARFVRVCDRFNVPLVSLADTPGFLPGREQEQRGLALRAAGLVSAQAEATVPRITVVLRKALGPAFHAMGSRETGTDLVFAWPGAEVALVSAEAAVGLLHRREIDGADDPRATAAELAAHHRAEVASPYAAAARGLITDVIAPGETRDALALALRTLIAKREMRPVRKRGNPSP